MKRSDLNARLRAYAKDRLTPTPSERTLVSNVYAALQNVLSANSCLQIGSYPRFTAITPLHDLDVLYVLGSWDPRAHDPSSALQHLEGRLRASFVNPTSYRVAIGRQTHSITLSFADARGDEQFAVDVVPAYVSGRNEFGEDTYVVPEIAVSSHRERRRIVSETAEGRHAMRWLHSDPRGYIRVAARLNEANGDFRKAVKLVKGWRASCKEKDDTFQLKSFHLEQLVTNLFLRDANLDAFGAVFQLFCALPSLIAKAHIRDRADATRFIDEYVKEFDGAQRASIAEARDSFLIKLEDIVDTPGAIAQLLTASRRKRFPSEVHLFDSRIPVLTECDFHIVGTVLERAGFRRYILDALGVIDIDRKIAFRLGSDAPPADKYKWKVKNDDSAPEPRGEITDNRTKNDPEHTKYRGAHLVECFAIRAGICIGRSRQNVVLRGHGG